MIPVGVSRMKKTCVAIVEPGAKVNNEYYCEHFRRRGFLSQVHYVISSEFFGEYENYTFLESL